MIDHFGLLKRCLETWNRADAEAVAECYSEELDYRDPNVPQGIRTRREFVRYLKLLFRKYPRQEWEPTDVMAHEKPGAFSVCYRYRYANAREDVTGAGMDRIEFDGEKIRLNWVFLNPDRPAKAQL